MRPRLSRYEVLGRLATGGMAHVWLARAVGLAGFEKLVVLKTILPALAENAQFTDMFINEARLAAMLNHPNCVQIFDLGREADVLFIAMEYIEGFSLSRVLRRCETTGTAVPIKIICRVVMDGLAGLDYAHQLISRDGKAMHLVHRDVSPDNLLLSFTGQTKVVDFGIAKAAAEPRSREGSTRTGTVKGKFGYMAPEYLRGDPVDARADVFAMGVLLYRALTGRKPFNGATDAMVTMSVLTETPAPPSGINTILPKALDQVIARSLEKEPARRFESARAMRSAIEAAMPGVSDTEAVGVWLKALWPPGDDERAALESLAASSGTDESSGPVLESVVSEDVDLAFTQSGVTVRTSDGEVSRALATPAYGEPPPRSKAPFIIAGLVAAAVAGFFALPKSQPKPQPSPPLPAIEAPPAAVQPPQAVKPPDPPDPPASADAPPDGKKPPEAAGPRTGWLEVASTPTVNVVVKGRSLGRTPLRVSLGVGKHVLKLTDPAAGIEKSVQVVVRSGETTKSTVTFSKGRLDLRVSPWARVKLDGKELGNTPIPVQELYEGTHSLELTNPELSRTKKLDVRVVAGETKLVRETLE